MSLHFNPIGPWPLVAITAIAVVVLTLYAYRQRLRGSTGRWRWFALGLRMSAVILCLLGALRPSAIVMIKSKVTASIVFLIDSSSSMAITDEVGGQSRWNVARAALGQAQEDVKKAVPGLNIKTYRFDEGLHDDKPDDTSAPKGRQTALGSAFEDLLKRKSGEKIAAIVVFADGANNNGADPKQVAQRLHGLSIPVHTVGVGTASAGPSSRDLAARSINAGSTVFIKNELLVDGTIQVRGYPNQDIEVELLVEGQAAPVASKKVRATQGQEILTVKDLKYIPQTSGEKKLTLRVKPKDNELVAGNNEVSTFITVLGGGLSVLYIQGPNFSWDKKFVPRALDAAPNIQTDLKLLTHPAQGTKSDLDDADLVKYDVYILGDVPAEYLTRDQQRLLVAAVEKRGAGLVMLGGRSSFGAGNWAGTPVETILPVEIHPGDGQLEPEGGLKVVPNVAGLDNYVLQLGPNRAETARLWEELPTISGANRLGQAKPGAIILAQSAQGDPLIVGQEVPKGRVLAFAGETWPWARATEETQKSHRRFWRQTILWLSHKENEGDGQITLSLDQRRIGVGQKLEVTAVAKGPQGETLADVQFESTITSLNLNGKTEPFKLYNQANEAKGTYYANQDAGDYKVSVKARLNGKEIGSDSARFLVYQDDRELDNPAADHDLLRQISIITGGKSLPPEQLVKDFKSLSAEVSSDDFRQVEYRLWDNWPFLLVFAAVLSLEWWLRKRKGWV